MKKIEDQIIQTLNYKGREDLAKLLNYCRYELNESSTYGSRLYSVLTTVVIYVGIEKLGLVGNLDDSDKEFIIEAFKVIYPVKDDSYEITSIEFRQYPNALIPGSSNIRIPSVIEFEHWKEGFFRLFISHSSFNKDIAKEFKDEMYKYGISAFIAHEDIKPTKEWQNVIESSLINCDGVLAILNSKFKESLWCDQEIGFAFGQNKIIVPVNFELNPYGFISKFQALKNGRKTISEIAVDIWKILISNDLSSRKASYAIVKVFCESSSIKDVEHNLKLLEEIKYFDIKIYDEIIEAVVKNIHISKSAEIKKRILRFIEVKRKLNH